MTRRARPVSTRPAPFPTCDLPGRRIYMVCGPGESPTETGAFRRGLIIGLGENRWGAYLKVVWDDEPGDEQEESAHGLKDAESDKGIGLYVGLRLVPAHQVQLAFAIPPTASVH